MPTTRSTASRSGEAAAGKVTLERDGINWNITAPEGLKADIGAVNGLLWRIRDLRASGFLDESPAGVAALPVQARGDGEDLGGGRQGAEDSRSWGCPRRSRPASWRAWPRPRRRARSSWSRSRTSGDLSKTATDLQ